MSSLQPTPTLRPTFLLPGNWPICARQIFLLTEAPNTCYCSIQLWFRNISVIHYAFKKSESEALQHFLLLQKMWIMPEESCEVNHPKFPRTNGPDHTRWQFCGTPVWRGAPGGRWQRTVILPFIRVSTVSTATSGASAALYTRFLPTPPKCTMSPKPIHPLKSLKIKNSAWHFLSTNEKSFNNSWQQAGNGGSTGTFNPTCSYYLNLGIFLDNQKS